VSDQQISSSRDAFLESNQVIVLTLTRSIRQSCVDLIEDHHAKEKSAICPGNTPYE
jgi:hypothetical protein